MRCVNDIDITIAGLQASSISNSHSLFPLSLSGALFRHCLDHINYDVSRSDQARASPSARGLGDRRVPLRIDVLPSFHRSTYDVKPAGVACVHTCGLIVLLCLYTCTA